MSDIWYSNISGTVYNTPFRRYIRNTGNTVDRFYQRIILLYGLFILAFTYLLLFKFIKKKRKFIFQCLHSMVINVCRQIPGISQPIERLVPNS